MAFVHTEELISNALSYDAYCDSIYEQLEQTAYEESARRMQQQLQQHVSLMKKYDSSYQLTDTLKQALQAAPPATWLVISEGSCGDAAFSLPMLSVIEKALPEQVHLRIVLRSSEPELMEAYTTNGSRAIPKMIVLNKELKEVGTWGPRPAGLQILINEWKNEGISVKDIIPRVYDWYDADEADCLQTELTELVQQYS